MSKPTDRITVSRSKRGTTVKATGAAAQRLFDALSKPAAKPTAEEAADQVARAVDQATQGQTKPQTESP